jgi:UDP-N-acetylmuramoyl-tripeptide--D-alanyl-D-alanine ligase
MPREARYGVFEMGMNHAGELAALNAVVRPHVAIVTAIARHREFFTARGDCDAKGEIFQGLEEGGTALSRSTARTATADRRARPQRPISPSASAKAPTSGARGDRAPGGTLVTRSSGAELTYTIAAGEHWVSNSLAVSAPSERSAGPCPAGRARGHARLKGRGERHRFAGRRRSAADRRELQRQSRFHARDAEDAGAEKDQRQPHRCTRGNGANSGRDIGMQFHAGLAEQSRPVSIMSY